MRHGLRIPDRGFVPVRILALRLRQPERLYFSTGVRDDAGGRHGDTHSYLAEPQLAKRVAAGARDDDPVRLRGAFVDSRGFGFLPDSGTAAQAEERRQTVLAFAPARH